MSLYAHVSTKDEIPGQKAYFLETLGIGPVDAFGNVSPDRVTTRRYLVAGPLLMCFTKRLTDKQGRWTATYLASDEQAQQALREVVTTDAANGDDHSRVTELSVGLNESDLVQIRDRAKRGIDARWRAVHWTANHLGTPVILDGNRVELEGGID